MTKGEAINALYAVFNAPHNADINIAYLNKILDDLVATEREECAKMAEAFHRHGYDFTGDLELHEAIRSRT